MSEPTSTTRGATTTPHGGDARHTDRTSTTRPPGPEHTALPDRPPATHARSADPAGCRNQPLEGVAEGVVAGQREKERAHY